MAQKNFTLIFNHVEQEHFGKDVFLVPYYIGKINNYKTTIVYPHTETNKNFASVINGVNMHPLLHYNIYKEILYIIRHARKIDILMRFHYSRQTKIIFCLYKLLNSHGFTYLKGDMNFLEVTQEIRTIQNEKRTFSIKKMLKNIFMNISVKCTDVFSCETKEVYNNICECKLPKYAFKKIIQIRNGFDEDMLQQMPIKIKDYSQKENIIITVGRLGTEQKNTEMFIKALENINLNDWKVYLIGPIEKSLSNVIDDFYQKYPEKKTNVIFTNAIYNKQKLWEYYNRAKVFVLTSRYEGCAIVYNEAYRFKNYIVTTMVGGAYDFVGDNKYGCYIAQENHTQLTNVLQDIIDGKTNVDVYKDTDTSLLSWQNILSEVNFPK